jgi:E3 ubiquitin-protein ligase Arkadia
VFPHFSAGGNFYPPPELNAAQVHSNQYNRHSIDVVEGGLLDQTMSTGRGPFKRKGTGVSTSRERGGTSGIYSAGSTSNSFELHHEKPTSDYRNNFDSSGLPPYTSSSLSIGCEDSPRNVRSRSRLDLEPNPRRTHLLSYSSHPFSSTSHLRNHPGPVDASNLNADITAYEQPYWYSSSCTWEVSYLRLV